MSGLTTFDKPLANRRAECIGIWHRMAEMAGIEELDRGQFFCPFGHILRSIGHIPPSVRSYGDRGSDIRSSLAGQGDQDKLRDRGLLLL